MTPFDLILIWVSLAWAVLFLVLWMSKLIKFYIGLLIGLLICILINLKLNNIVLSWVTANGSEEFLSNNRDTLWNLALAAIPFMGLLFLLNRSFIIQESEGSEGWIWSTIWKFLMGLSLFPLVLWMYSTVGSLGISTSSVLNWLLEAFKTSIILSGIWKYGQYIFYILLGLMLYKFIFRFLFYLLMAFFNKIRELRAEEREIRRRKAEGDEHKNEDEDEDEENKGH